jgi:rhodanese-related sulfurtransferase
MTTTIMGAAQAQDSTSVAASAAASAPTASTSKPAPRPAPAVNGPKRPEGSCYNENIPEVNLPTAPLWEADLSCGISVPELQKQLSAPDLALVDLRNSDAFQGWHINGALNLTLTDLHAKPYWRNKQVVLIGNGKAEREWYGACRHLKQNGYANVRVLRGGMPAWLGQQGAVLGRVTERVPQMLRLSTAEFWLETQSPDHLVLLSPSQKAMYQELPLSTILAQDTPEAVLAVLARHRKQTKAAALAGVLLAAPASISEEQITRLQKVLAPLPLLVYTESRAALQQHIAQQKQIWLAQARGPRQLGCGL